MISGTGNQGVDRVDLPEQTWAARPTCHGNDSRNEATWRDPQPDEEPAGRPFRTCSYCGSIHPEDLLRFLAAGATIEVADMKFGWPHKFYVNGVPNPHAGKQVQVGTVSTWEGDQRVDTPRMGLAPEHAHVKWYNDHVLDEMSEAQSDALRSAIRDATGIVFDPVGADGKLRWHRERSAS